jgi:23S rRNA (pseudouridine1915-N3)-methyltransferase
MRLALVAFGKLKTPGLRESADYYRKLLRTWTELEEIELKPLSVPDKSEATRRKIQEKEGELLLAKLEQTRSYYLLDERGKALDTQGWARLARSWEESSSGGAGAGVSVALCIGSSLGFSEEVRSRARGLLSLGPQTLSHELARVVLLEQVYRAWSVNRGHPYHNEGV